MPPLLADFIHAGACIPICEKFLTRPDVVEEHVDTAQVVGGDIDLLAVEAVADSVTAQHLHSLQQQRAGAAGGVYKDVIFDTSPVAGKVYKNSENRRKQGVSCGFRCICRCSICPVRAQPWCARC